MCIISGSNSLWIIVLWIVGNVCVTSYTVVQVATLVLKKINVTVSSSACLVKFL